MPHDEVRFQVRLTPKTHAAAKQKAKDENRSLNAQIEYLLKTHPDLKQLLEQSQSEP